MVAGIDPTFLDPCSEVIVVVFGVGVLSAYMNLKFSYSQLNKLLCCFIVVSRTGLARASVTRCVLVGLTNF